MSLWFSKENIKEALSESEDFDADKGVADDIYPAALVNHQFVYDPTQESYWTLVGASADAPTCAIPSLQY